MRDFLGGENVFERFLKMSRSLETIFSIHILQGKEISWIYLKKNEDDSSIGINYNVNVVILKGRHEPGFFEKWPTLFF